MLFLLNGLRTANVTPSILVTGTRTERGLNARCHVRSEEHTSELQSPCNLVCRLLLEKKTETDSRSNLYVCGNGGAKPKHTLILAQHISQEPDIKFIDTFLMYSIHNADRVMRSSSYMQ